MRLSLLLSIVVLATTPVTSSAARTTRAPAVATDGYQVVRSYPHDPGAFTEGLFYLKGYLYESTGLEGESEVRKVRLETGEVVQRRAISPQYFGEGIVGWKDRLFELTWKDEVGFIYDLPTQLVAAFRATLEEVTGADVITFLINQQPSIWDIPRPWPLALLGWVYPALGLLTLAAMPKLLRVGQRAGVAL